MNTPHKISDILPSTCQKLLKSVEIWVSSWQKIILPSFFETQCDTIQHHTFMRIFAGVPGKGASCNSTVR